MSGESPLGRSEGIISYCAICTRKDELTREAACRFLHGIRIRLAHATNGRFRKVHFAICMTGNGRELPVDLANQLAQLQTFRHDTPSACSTIRQPSRIFRTSVPILRTSFRLLMAVNFLIAASNRQASDWFRQANLTINRRGGLAQVNGHRVRHGLFRGITPVDYDTA
jgi:hypothetical protein